MKLSLVFVEQQFDEHSPHGGWVRGPGIAAAEDVGAHTANVGQRRCTSHLGTFELWWQGAIVHVLCLLVCRVFFFVRAFSFQETFERLRSVMMSHVHGNRTHFQVRLSQYSLHFSCCIAV